jgi:hypothetical protein
VGGSSRGWHGVPTSAPIRFNRFEHRQSSIVSSQALKLSEIDPNSVNELLLRHLVYGYGFAIIMLGIAFPLGDRQPLIAEIVRSGWHRRHSFRLHSLVSALARPLPYCAHADEEMRLGKRRIGSNSCWWPRGVCLLLSWLGGCAQFRGPISCPSRRLS